MQGNPCGWGHIYVCAEIHWRQCCTSDASLQLKAASSLSNQEGSPSLRLVFGALWCSFLCQDTTPLPNWFSKSWHGVSTSVKSNFETARSCDEVGSAQSWIMVWYQLNASEETFRWLIDGGGNVYVCCLDRCCLWCHRPTLGADAVGAFVSPNITWDVWVFRFGALISALFCDRTASRCDFVPLA